MQSVHVNTVNAVEVEPYTYVLMVTIRILWQKQESNKCFALSSLKKLKKFVRFYTANVLYCQQLFTHQSFYW